MPIDFLQSPLFSSASNKSRRLLNNLAIHQQHKKGELILAAEQAKTRFLYIVEGNAKLFKDSANGEEVVLGILGQGHHCGEQFLFEQNVSEAYNSKAVTETRYVKWFTTTMSHFQITKRTRL